MKYSVNTLRSTNFRCVQKLTETYRTLIYHICTFLDENRPKACLATSDRVDYWLKVLHYNDSEYNFHL